jgi:hypothetical protein
MSSCADLRRQAARCLRVAAAVEDRTTAAALVAIADDFSAQADQIDPSLDSTPSRGSSGDTRADDTG